MQVPFEPDGRLTSIKIMKHSQSNVKNMIRLKVWLVNFSRSEIRIDWIINTVYFTLYNI